MPATGFTKKEYCHPVNRPDVLRQWHFLSGKNASLLHSEGKKIMNCDTQPEGIPVYAMTAAQKINWLERYTPDYLAEGAEGDSGLLCSYVAGLMTAMTAASDGGYAGNDVILRHLLRFKAGIFSEGTFISEVIAVRNEAIDRLQATSPDETGFLSAPTGMPYIRLVTGSQEKG